MWQKRTTVDWSLQGQLRAQLRVSVGKRLLWHKAYRDTSKTITVRMKPLENMSYALLSRQQTF
jgi:hypothetical protein